PTVSFQRLTIASSISATDANGRRNRPSAPPWPKCVSLVKKTAIGRWESVGEAADHTRNAGAERPREQRCQHHQDLRQLRRRRDREAALVQPFGGVEIGLLAQGTRDRGQRLS